MVYAPAALVGAIIMVCAQERYEELDEIFCNFIPTRSDNIGLNYIYY